MEKSALLTVSGISKNFAGLRALSEVSFSVFEGQIKALIGPNGAGKSTLFNIISGLLKPTTGTIVFRHKDITSVPPHQRCREGIGRVFQLSQLFWDSTALDNVRAGYDWHLTYDLVSAGLRLPHVSRSEKAAYLKATDILNRLGLSGKAEVIAKNLPLGEQRLLEISRALATEPHLLLLDEPAAGLNATETQRLMTVVRKIRENGITVLLIEHNMKMVMDISDEVVVLDFGEKIAEGRPRDIQTNEMVIAAYLGDKVC